MKTHPTVLDAVAVGIPDDRFGEMVTGVIEARPGEDDRHRRRHRPRQDHARRLQGAEADRRRRHHRPRRERQGRLQAVEVRRDDIARRRSELTGSGLGPAAMDPPNFGVRSPPMFEFRPPAVVQADAELAGRLSRRRRGRGPRRSFTRYGGLVYRIACGRRLRVRDELTRRRRPTHACTRSSRRGATPRCSSRVAASGPGSPRWPHESVGARRIPGSGRRAALDVERCSPTRASWTDPPAELADRVVAGDPGRGHRRPGRALHGRRPPCGAGTSARGSTSVRPFVVGAIAAVVLLVLGVMVLSALGGADVEHRATTIDLRPTGRVLDVSGSIEVDHRRRRSADRARRADAARPRHGGWYEGWVHARRRLDRLRPGRSPAADDVELTAAVDVADARSVPRRLTDDDPSAVRPTPTSSSVAPLP